MPRVTSTERPKYGGLPLWLAGSLLVILFFCGGSSRSDEPRLLFAMIGSGIIGAASLMLPTKVGIGRFWLFAGIVGGWIALTLLPMPPALWHHLPGRTFFAEIFRNGDLSCAWHSLSATPDASISMLAGLLIPVATMATFSKVQTSDWKILVSIVLAFNLLSGFVGLLQALGASDLFFFYKVTNPAAAVGLMANRNHQAALLVITIPMIATVIDFQRWTSSAVLPSIVILAIFLITPLVLITGSRFSLILLVVACAFTAAIVLMATPTGRPKTRVLRLIIIVTGLVSILSMVTVAVYTNRDVAVSRLSADSIWNDQRWQLLAPTVKIAIEYLPFGSGAGSFVSVFKVHEPFANLSPYYWNHAHDDYLESFIEFGAVGFLLLLLVAAWWLRRSIQIWDRGQKLDIATRLGRLGSAMTGLLALASWTDYSLRTPILAAQFILACMMMEQVRRPAESVDAAKAAL